MQIDLPNTVKTVSQITAEIKLLLEGGFRFVAVSGEISNLRTPFSGHHYFTLKDSGAQLRAVMFKGQQRYLAEPLRDGQQVICRGRISVYEPRGEYQLIVDTVDQHGLGVLQMKFAALKQRLAEEGLFAPERKRPLPPFPTKIVVVSSPTGAAIHDFLKICRRRKSGARIQIFPVAVQGSGAAEEIARALDVVNEKLDCDIIVLCRGGGSLEDLWAFNEEVVARAIVRSRVPVVTGVGHEIDFTIADFCADVRTPTPTGAAEMIIPDTAHLAERLAQLRQRLRRSILQTLGYADHRLERQWRQLGSLQSRLENTALRLDLLIDRFLRTGRSSLDEKTERLNALLVRLEKQAPLHRISMQTQAVEHLHSRLRRQMLTLLKHHDDRLAKAAALLDGVSPLSTLSRGYSIVQARDRRTGETVVVSDSAQVDTGDSLQVLLHRGQLLCEVVESKVDPSG